MCVKTLYLNSKTNKLLQCFTQISNKVPCASLSSMYLRRPAISQFGKISLVSWDHLCDIESPMLYSSTCCKNYLPFLESKVVTN